MKKKVINVIEIDGRDARFQTGIGRYLDVLQAELPAHVNVLRIIFYWSPEISDIRIVQNEAEVSVFHPGGYPSTTLFDAVLTYLSPRISKMSNLIVKSNCLGYEVLAYMLRSRFYAKTIGMLHCLPHRAPGYNPNVPMNNSFFNMDHIVLVCDDAVEFVKRTNCSRPYTVIYNGISVPKIASKKLDDGVFRFIFANGWAQHKGIKRIIPAIKQVAEKHNIEIMVIGGHDKNDKVFEEIAGLPIKNVGLLTKQDDISRYYEMADAALFASFSEACSFAGIEAMAYNLPIVSSDAVGLVEMFGRAALIVKSDKDGNLDVDDYANQMVRIIENKALRTKLGILAYARYKERYTARKMVKDTVKLYERLVSGY
ncbi:MAG: glycosyltransferase family 4 protein [Alphaproteobacteria bacterium]|nr:glycosyltransferase family 4 protein [Alphaproteobacteria bacterium]